MIKISIPGRQFTLVLDTLLLDLNGTLAVDGILLEGVKERIEVLRDKVKIYLLTADTFGAARGIAEELDIELLKVGPEDGGQDKLDMLNTLQGENCAAVGNGYNDRLMLAAAGLSIAVIEGEGCSVKALQASDIAVRSINDALDLLINPLRTIATLRS